MEDLSEASKLVGKAVQQLSPFIQPQLVQHIKEALKKHGKKAKQGFFAGLDEGDQ